MAASRRSFLKTSALGSVAVLTTPAWATDAPSQVGRLPEKSIRSYALNLTLSDPVTITAIDMLDMDGVYLVRVRSSEGVEGMVQAPRRTLLSMPTFKEQIVPYFVGQDARNLERLVDDFYYHGRHYKMTGIGLWRPFGTVELAILDLLGKLEGKPVGALFGTLTKTRVPVYVSRFERDQAVDVSLARLERDLAEMGHGAQAVKLKIGGRMSRNADAFPGRTEAYIPAARKLLGDDFVIYVDSNGSYDAPKAIEVGMMLQDYGVAMYEEPCPFEDYESTRIVTAGLHMPVSGGEQDWSLWVWERMVKERIVDIVQPDFMMCGGFLRALKIAAWAEAYGMEVTPHSPIWGPASAIKAQYAALIPNAGYYQEHRTLRPPGDWYAPQFPIGDDGAIEVPQGPGWGITYDEDRIRNATLL